MLEQTLQVLVAERGTLLGQNANGALTWNASMQQPTEKSDYIALEHKHQALLLECAGLKKTFALQQANLREHAALQHKYDNLHQEVEVLKGVSIESKAVPNDVHNALLKQQQGRLQNFLKEHSLFNQELGSFQIIGQQECVEPVFMNQANSGPSTPPNQSDFGVLPVATQRTPSPQVSSGRLPANSTMSPIREFGSFRKVARTSSLCANGWKTLPSPLQAASPSSGRPASLTELGSPKTLTSLHVGPSQNTTPSPGTLPSPTRATSAYRTPARHADVLSNSNVGSSP